jgi:hypothetical protein
MNLANTQKEIVINPTKALYHWARIFNRLQRQFFVEDVKLRREKQIEDFVVLNGFKRVRFKIDTDLFRDFDQVEFVAHSSDADIVVITDQKFSRYPCPFMIKKIQEQLSKCPRLYLCLNRHYINIDNSYHDPSLNTDFPVAIAQWLRKNLSEANVIDLSLNYRDYGGNFTWAVPDRHFFIESRNAKNC